MKFILKTLFVLLAGALFFIASCKKDAKSTVAKTSITPAQYGQTAVNLYRALTGQYGGASINNGLKAPAAVVTGNRSHVLQSTNILCGYTVDTAYTGSITTSGDTTTNSSGSLQFIYNCNANVVNGYTLHDSLTAAISAPGFSNNIITGQNYNSTATDATLKIFSVNGGITSTTTTVYNGPPLISHFNRSSYILTGLTVNNTSPLADITTGVATFTMLTVDIGPAYGVDGTFGGYSGTITYLGNHMATLLVNGVGSYSVNLLTGATTPL